MEVHVSELLSAYLDGELGEASRRRVEAHLDVCEDCALVLAQYRQLSRTLQSLPEPEFTPANVAAAQIGAGLQPRPERPARDILQPRNGLAQRLWKILPVGLIAGWAYTQAVLALVGLGRLWGVDLPGGELLEGLAILRPEALASWAVIDGWEIGSMVVFGLFSLATTLAVGILLWGWMASWWVYQRGEIRIANQVAGQTGI